MKRAAVRAAISCLLLAVLPATAGAFMIGVNDGIYEGANGSVWLDRTVAAGARFVVLPVDWGTIAARRPRAGSDSASPTNPDYNWVAVDAAVRAAVARRITVALTVAPGGGPAWADGPHRPPWAQPGTWRPNANALRSFATALARRYSGSFNPGSGVLPRVRYYEAWSEPNLNNHLNPQWIRSGHRWVAESPIIYRGLLNAFYAGVKSVHRSSVVIAGSTAPFGDGEGGRRVRPATFVRNLLCLTARLKPTPCRDPAHFDILSHHPYAIGGPFTHSRVAADVSVPDLGKLSRPLIAAERNGRALPRGHKQLWVTEFSWDSRPPDPHGVPMKRFSRWVAEALYEFWREGVGAVAWLSIVDRPPIPSYASTYQSGIYFLNGAPKPARRALRFPFVVEPAGRGHERIWGLAPRTGTVLVQRLTRNGWHTLRSFRRGAHAVFTALIKPNGKTLMRAKVGDQTSLAFRSA